jgi:hypothetical protein
MEFKIGKKVDWNKIEVGEVFAEEVLGDIYISCKTEEDEYCDLASTNCDVVTGNMIEATYWQHYGCYYKLPESIQGFFCVRD